MSEKEGDIVPLCHLAWVAGGMRMPLSLKATSSALPPTFCPRKPLPFPTPAQGPLTSPICPHTGPAHLRVNLNLAHLRWSGAIGSSLKIGQRLAHLEEQRGA